MAAVADDRSLLLQHSASSINCRLISSKPKSDGLTSRKFPHIPSRSMHFLSLILSLITLLVLYSLYPYLINPPRPLQNPADQYYTADLHNIALLNLAAVDLSDTVMAQQASVLLDEAWKPSLADRLWDRVVGRSEPERLEAARLKLAKEGHRIPISLSSPWYARQWGQMSDALRRWVGGRNVFEPRIMFSLLRAVKDPIDKHYIKVEARGDHDHPPPPPIGEHAVELGKPYRSCAVVGNSGILLNSSYSSLIDSHHAVIRLNNAKTAGFEQYVGGKTTLAFINSNVLHSCSGRNRCYCQPYGAKVPTLLYICQPAHFIDVSFCSESQEAPILVTDPRLDTLCARIVKYYSLKAFVETTGRRLEEWSDAHDGPFFHYSSGMQAVMVALGICQKVSLFGFGKAAGAKHHYHTGQQSELHLHDYAAEYQFYQDLQYNASSKLLPFLSQSGFSLPPLQVFL